CSWSDACWPGTSALSGSRTDDAPHADPHDAHTERAAVMLQITGLTHSYAVGHKAIDGLDLTVPDGQLLSIVGPSGCGKSTLLRAIAGLIRTTGGRITLDCKPINGVPDDLAVVFQDYSRSPLPWLTVRDNVALPLRRPGKSRAERRAAAQEALESVGLPDAGRKYPWQLS